MALKLKKDGKGFDMSSGLQENKLVTLWAQRNLCQ